MAVENQTPNPTPQLDVVPDDRKETDPEAALERTVRDHPWACTGAAVFAGAVLGKVSRRVPGDPVSHVPTLLGSLVSLAGAAALRYGVASGIQHVLETATRATERPTTNS